MGFTRCQDWVSSGGMKWKQTPLLTLLGAILVGWTAGHWYFQRESEETSAALGSVPGTESKQMFPADSFEGQMQATTEVAALAKLWKGMAEGDRSTWDWKLKAAALWQRWAELDLDSALASLPALQPIEEGKPTGMAALLFRPGPGKWPLSRDDIPRRALFAVFAKQELERAMVVANKLPHEEAVSAQIGILEVMVSGDPKRFFDLAAQLTSKFGNLPDSIIPEPLRTAAFAKLVESDSTAALRMLEDHKTVFDVFGYYQNNAWETLWQHWRQSDPVGAGRWLLSKDEGTFMPAAELTASLLPKLARQDPALAYEVVSRKGGWSLDTLVAEDFALASEFAKQFPDNSGIHALEKAIAQVKPKDIPLAAAWIEGLKDKDYARASTLNLFPVWQRAQPGVAMDWLLQRTTEDVRNVALQQLISGSFANERTYPEQDRMLAELPPEVNTGTVAQMLKEGGLGDVSRALELLDRLPAGAAKDAALAKTVQVFGTDFPELAKALQTQVTDVSLQASYQAHSIAAAYIRAPDTAVAAFQSLPNGSLRDAVVDEMRRTYMAEDPAAAWQWTLQLSDPAKRKTNLGSLLENWPAERREEAKHCLETSKSVLTETEREALGRRIR